MDNKELDLDAYLQYNLQEQALMNEDLTLLRTIKDAFEHLMLAHEIKLVNQYISTIKNNNYRLSKKNLSRLTDLINILQARQQAQEQATQAQQAQSENPIYKLFYY